MQEDFVHDAEIYFDNKPEDFYQRLITTFHTVIAIILYF